MSYLKAGWSKIPASWKNRLYGAAGTGIGVYAGPQAKEAAGVVWACLRAHYGF